MTYPLSRRSALAVAGSAAIAPLMGCGKAPQISAGTSSARAASVADDAFQSLGADWIEASCRTQPVMATELGNHAYDAELDDVSATGRAAA
ncbi:MAG: hypothetical protein SGJ21_02915, partial [Alphaproteobacteria bacterium]|nr:hypothetical protein [Alphaproteobacteria bacterium]